MAPTTAPNVFCTASPTFRAIKVPPSSSKAASSSSVGGKQAHRQTHSIIDDKEETGITSHIMKDPCKNVSNSRCIPVGIPLLWKQASQTLTGSRPQPLSGTGRVFEEQESQKPSPQARQWCLVSLGRNSSPHLWHFYSIVVIV